MNGPAAENPIDPDESRESNRHRDGEPQSEGIAGTRRGIVHDDPLVGRHPRRLLGHRDERRLGDRRPEAEAEREDEKPGKTRLAGESVGEHRTDRKQACLQSLHEQRETEHDAREAHQQLRQVRDGLAQHQDLEHRDHDNDRREVPGTVPKGSDERLEHVVSAMPGGGNYPAN